MGAATLEREDLGFSTRFCWERVRLVEINSLGLLDLRWGRSNGVTLVDVLGAADAAAVAFAVLTGAMVIPATALGTGQLCLI